MKFILSLRTRALPMLVLLCVMSLFLSFSRVLLAAEGEEGEAPGAQPDILAPNDPRNMLHLNADQQVSIEARHEKFQQDAASILSSANLNHAQKDAAIDQLFDGAEKDLRAMLTPEQRAEVDKDAVIEARNQQIRRETLQEKFDLSNALQKTITPAQLIQMEKVEGIAEQMKASIYEDPTMSTADKGKRLAALERAYNSEMADILNTPQQRQLEQQITVVQREEQAAETQAVTQL